MAELEPFLGHSAPCSGGKVPTQLPQGTVPFVACGTILIAMRYYNFKFQVVPFLRVFLEKKFFALFQVPFYKYVMEGEAAYSFF